MPFIGILLGGISFSSLTLTIGNAVIAYGNFIQAVVNFLIIAWVIFLIVRTINRLQKQPEPEAAAPPALSDEVKLLTEIRDILNDRT